MKSKLIVLALMVLFGMSTARAQTVNGAPTCGSVSGLAAGYIPIYTASNGQLVSVGWGYTTTGLPSSVSVQLAASYFPSSTANPADEGTAQTNTSGVLDAGSVSGPFTNWYAHITTLSGGTTPRLTVNYCVTPVANQVPLSTVASNVLIKGGGAATASSLTDNGTTLSSSDSLTFTGGIVPNSARTRICNSAPGTALATAGTNTTLAAATTFTYVSSVYVPENKTITGVSVLSGGTAGAANHWEVALYPATGGATLAKSATAASAASTNSFTDYPFSATYAAVGPALYFVGFQSDGTTDKIQTVAAANSWGDVLTQKPASTAYGTFPSLTAPTTFTADVGPIVCLY